MKKYAKTSGIRLLFLLASLPSIAQSNAYFNNDNNTLYLPEVDAGNLGFYNASLKLTEAVPVTFSLDNVVQIESTENPSASYQSTTGALSVFKVGVNEKFYAAELKTVASNFDFELISLTEVPEMLESVPSPSNVHHADKMLIVISAPSIQDPYYKDAFNDIIEFDVQYAKAIMGKDNVVVLADKDTLPYFKNKLPHDILLEAEVEDIWIRDFGTVHPSKMLKFAYDRPSETSIEQSFVTFAKENLLDFSSSTLKVDGGNVVDNNQGRLILTEKVLARNPTLSYDQVIAQLKSELNATEIAIISMDETFLGHSDGMVMFVDEDTVIMNDYKGSPDLKAEVLAELKEGLTGVDIHEIDGAGYGEQYGNYASACGIYVNSVVTHRYIYAPTFGTPDKDTAAVQKIQSLTDKTVVTVDTQKVCYLGGNTRCLSWQLTGENAKKLIEAARRY
jgi:agmatine/peptidylarginine deiminase